MTVPVRIQSKAKGVWFEGLPEKLSEAVDAYDLPGTPDWGPLDELSSATRFDGVEVYGKSAVIEGEALVAPSTVYVKLRYDPGSSDPIEMSERFPASVHFRVEPDMAGRDVKTIVIERIDVDTSAFFER